MLLTVIFGGIDNPFLMSLGLYPKEGTSAKMTSTGNPASSTRFKISFVTFSSAGWYNWNHAFPSVICAIVSILAVDTVLRTNGILYLKGGELTEELYGISHKQYQISDFFEEEFFNTKKVIYIKNR